LARVIKGPYEASEMEHFLDTFLYREDAFLIDEVTSMDHDARRIEARLDHERSFPFAKEQRTDANHPAHFSVGELVMVTGCLGCMHAWFFHGCRWDEGWVGFGSRIHRADFKRIALLDAPLELESRETRTRVGERRLVLRYDFVFRQRGEIVYKGDQSAMFLKDADLGQAGQAD
jgi:hypothetical protein